MTKKRKPKLSDQQLFDLAEENEELERRIARLSNKLAKAKEEVIKELEARGTQALERDGRRINGVWGNDTIIDDIGLLEDLTPKQKKRVMDTVFSRKRLSQAIQAGYIDMAVLTKHSGTKPRKPYYRLTTPQKGKKK